VIVAIHHAVLVLGGMTLVSSAFFLGLRKDDGRSISQYAAHATTED